MAKVIFGGKKSITIPADSDIHVAQIYLEGHDPAVFVITDSTIDLTINIEAGLTLGDIPYFTILGENSAPVRLSGIIPIDLCGKPNKDILDYYYENYALTSNRPLLFGVFFGIKAHLYAALIHRLSVTNTTSSDLASFVMDLVLVKDYKKNYQYKGQVSDEKALSRRLSPVLANFKLVR